MIGKEKIMSTHTSGTLLKPHYHVGTIPMQSPEPTCDYCGLVISAPIHFPMSHDAAYMLRQADETGLAVVGPDGAVYFPR